MSGRAHSGDTIVGGVRRVAFVRTENVNAVFYDHSCDCISEIILNQNQNWSVIFPKENAARFTQSVAEDNPNVWTMTLEISVRLASGSQKSCADRLKLALRSGALVVVELNNKTKLLLGYSVKSKCRVPMTLTSAVISAGNSEVKASLCESFKISWNDTAPARVVNALF